MTDDGAPPSLIPEMGDLLGFAPDAAEAAPPSPPMIPAMPSHTPLPPLAACLAAADEPDVFRPDAGPLVRIPRLVLDALIMTAGPGFGALALLMRDEGYDLAVFVSGGPSLARLPRRLVAVVSDRDEGAVGGPLGFDRPTVARLARAATHVVFSAHEDDDAAMLAGVAMAGAARGTLLFVDTAAARVGTWLDVLRATRPALPLIAAGAFAPRSVH